MIPYGRQSLSQEDIEGVVEVLRSDWLTQGPVAPKFEHAIAKKVGAQYAVSVNSATSALHLACLSLNLGPGDWLWTTPNSFVASANCGLYCGANVDFVDIDPDTFNMSADALSVKLADAERLDLLPKIVVPVHFAGQSCDMRSIHKLSQHYGFKIIEDASHAIGGQYQSKYIGNCEYSDMTIFSFHPVKIITTGEGGMVVTNNAEYADHMRRLRSHGITRNSAEMSHIPDGPWYYEQLELGFNYRMTDIQAALGLSQLSSLDNFIKHRKAKALCYEQAFASIPIRPQKALVDAVSAWHLYVIRVPVSQHLSLFEHLRTQGIGVNLHYIPIHLQPYYQQKGFKKGQFPQAEAYYHEAISLPMYATLSDEQQSLVINHVVTAFL